MYLRWCVIFIFLGIGCIHQALSRSSYYWTTRRVECVNHGLNVSRCSLHEGDSNAELNPGCFEEFDEKNRTRIYCRLNCDESDETTVLAKVPNYNHECNHHYNYELERRRKDWYLWRSEGCIKATIAFHIRCGFPRDPRIFYIQNKHLFEYEDNET